MKNLNQNSFFILIALLIMAFFLNACDKEDEPKEPTKNYSWIPAGYQLDVGNADEVNSPIKIYFINESTGFLSNKSTDGFSFVRTEDGCNLFSDLSNQIDGYVKEIILYENQTGYLVTSAYSLYKTTNLGENWIKIDNSGFNKVIQVGSNSSENVFMMSKDPFAFLYSNDGGTTWIEYENELDPFYNFEEVKFQFLDENPTTGFFNNRNTIFITTDDGGSWDSYFETDGERNYWFLDKNTAYLSSNLGVRKTINAGASFQQLSPLYVRFWQILSEHEIYAAQVVVVQKTVDEFQNMEVMEVDTPTGNEYDKYIRDISFYASGKGYAISGNGIVYRTAEQ